MSKKIIRRKVKKSTEPKEGKVEVAKNFMQGEEVDISIDLLVKAEWNPNEMEDDVFNLLVEELQDDGMVERIQVVPIEDGKFRIIGGHQRFAAASVLGWKTMPCIVLSGDKWKDEDIQKFMTVRLNVLKGSMNPEKFAKLYEEMATRYDREQMKEMLRMTEDAVATYVQDVKQSLKDADVPEEIREAFENSSAEIKTVDDISRVLNELFGRYGDTLDSNFMIFKYFGTDAEIMYVRTNPELWKVVKKISKIARNKGVDVNEVFLDLIDKEAIGKMEENIDE